MDERQDNAKREEERGFLRLLCSEQIAGERRVALAQLLDAGAFETDLYQVVFETIGEFGVADGKRVREMLAARVTNRGFADFEASEFLEGAGMTEGEAEAWAARKRRK